jgi:hypothetical protein
MLQHAPSTTRNDSVSPALLRQEGEHEPGATISPLDNGWEVRARGGLRPLDPDQGLRPWTRGIPSDNLSTKSG